ncbi:hypothetical protein DCO48_00970 [Pseudomonas sp. SDI]|uniref:hypothetical protein n=1 Tax=Pseudomonas sp. SDI TaxID=2170734 RepID=UPI000DE696D3|nr:hypothetical protein [Pseudomonas sp. SDI]PWB36050.1 hypothetical protein DCO48_00970 [Pseudomonas sp. SDI]
MSNDDLKIPTDYGFARIGGVMNYLTREFVTDLHAFDMAALASLSRLTSNQPRGEMTIQANAYSKEEQSAWSVSAAAKASANFPLCSVALEFHTDQSAGELSTASGMKLTVGYAVRDYKIKLSRDVTAAELYQCATPRFKEAYDAIANAETPEDWLAAYMDFQEDYGHGFITSLELISCAAGNLSVQYTSRATQNAQKWGGSITVGGVGGGASACTEYAKSQQAAGSQGTLTANVCGVPAESPAMNWARTLITSYAEKSIDTLTQRPPSAIAIPVTAAKLPDIPKITPPSKGDGLPPVKMNLNSNKDLVDYLKLKALLKDGGDIHSLPDWDECKKKPDESRAQVQEALNRHSSAIKKSVDELKFSDVAVSSPSAIEAIPSTLPAARRLRASARENSASGDIDFGDYAICGFGFESYSKYLPALKSKIAVPTKTGFFLVKHNLFIAARQIFAAYLNYIKDLPEAIRGTHIDSTMAARFSELLSQYVSRSRQELRNRREDGDKYFSGADYEHTVATFERTLRNDGVLRGAVKIYDYFMANFETFSAAPFGFALTVTSPSNETVYLSSDERYSFLPSWFSLPNKSMSTMTKPVMDYTVAKNSCRFIPVIRIVNDNACIVLATYTNNLAPPLKDFTFPWQLSVRTIDAFDYAPSGSEPVEFGGSGWLAVCMAKENGTAVAFPSIVPVNYPEYVVFGIFRQGLPPIPGVMKYTASLQGFHIERTASGELNLVGAQDRAVQRWPVSRTGEPYVSVDFSTPPGAFTVPGEVKLKPIDYASLPGATIKGIPMWYEFPFEQFKKSILDGYE